MLEIISNVILTISNLTFVSNSRYKLPKRQHMLEILGEFLTEPEHWLDERFYFEKLHNFA